MPLKKIMIVDDEPDITLTVKQYLEKSENPYRVICAESGRQCFELLAQGEIPDLIILDIMMPEINGWDVFDTLKEEPSWSHIPVIFLDLGIVLIASLNSINGE